MNGFLVIDKPAGVTSHDIVAAVRAVTGVRKVGHTGTLDPFATGVLVLALGHATRLVEFLDESLKVYRATVALGTATDTGDPTGEAIAESPIPALDDDTVLDALEALTGDRMQRPPPYSAVKHQGKPLYWYARRGEVVEVEARPITVHGMTLFGRTPTHLDIRIQCSRGTYARVLAEELAQELGTVGHLSALCRERSGAFVLDGAWTMPEIGAVVSEEPGVDWEDVMLRRRRDGPRIPWKPRPVVREALAARLTPMIAGLSHLPLLDVSGREARVARNGSAPSQAPPGLSLGGRYLVVEGSELLGVAELTGRGPRLRKVIPQDAPAS